jgi:hypothetical protein
VWEGFGWVEVPPSPNAQAYVIGCPSGSTEPALEKETVSGGGPDRGAAVAAATGAWLLCR